MIKAHWSAGRYYLPGTVTTVRVGITTGLSFVAAHGSDGESLLVGALETRTTRGLVDPCVRKFLEVMSVPLGSMLQLSASPNICQLLEGHINPKRWSPPHYRALALAQRCRAAEHRPPPTLPNPQYLGDQPLGSIWGTGMETSPLANQSRS